MERNIINSSDFLPSPEPAPMPEGIVMAEEVIPNRIIIADEDQTEVLRRKLEALERENKELSMNQIIQNQIPNINKNYKKSVISKIADESDEDFDDDSFEDVQEEEPKPPSSILGNIGSSIASNAATGASILGRSALQGAQTLGKIAARGTVEGVRTLGPIAARGAVEGVRTLVPIAARGAKYMIGKPNPAPLPLRYRTPPKARKKGPNIIHVEEPPVGWEREVGRWGRGREKVSITSIEYVTGWEIDKIIFNFNNGKSKEYGGEGGSNKNKIILDNDEKIIKIEQYYNGWHLGKKIIFYTNKREIVIEGKLDKGVKVRGMKSFYIEDQKDLFGLNFERGILIGIDQIGGSIRRKKRKTRKKKSKKRKKSTKKKRSTRSKISIRKKRTTNN